MSYAIQITEANGTQIVHALASAQTTIGSDPAADICLSSASHLLAQHVLVAPCPERCWVSTVAGSPLWDSAGMAVTAAYVPWGSRLTLGPYVFELQKNTSCRTQQLPRNRDLKVADIASEPAEPKAAGIHPGFLMLLIATLAYATLQGFTGSSGGSRRGLVDAPNLFEEEGRSCQGANAARRARVAEAQALAKSERAVFDLRDGVLAVELYAEAENCYRKAGMDMEAEYVLDVGSRFRQSMQEEYDLLRLRLSRALASDSTESAKRQIRRLSELLYHKADSRYGLALRRISARLSKQGKTL